MIVEYRKELEQEKFADNVSKQISLLMKQQNVTHYELAKRLGMTNYQVKKILSDPPKVPLKTISNVFFALGCSINLIQTQL